jgi:hypothetical protein
VRVITRAAVLLHVIVRVTTRAAVLLHALERVTTRAAVVNLYSVFYAAVLCTFLHNVDFRCSVFVCSVTV